MKALSLKQPWANLIATGLKTIETRIWTTQHRGPILICASKKVDTLAIEMFLSKGFDWTDVDWDLGVGVCVVDLVQCLPMRSRHEGRACCDVYPKAQAWVLENVQPIKPFPVKGQLSVFDVDCGQLEYIV